MTNAIAAVQDWSRRNVFQPLVSFVKTFNGQAGHDETKKFMLENEEVHTALATRVLHLESRIRVLTALGVVLVAVEVLRWILR